MLSPLIIETIVRAALLEDLGHGRDITTETLVPASARAGAIIRARKPGILAGRDIGLAAFTLTDPDFDIEIHAVDGDILEAGQDIASVEGPASAILTAERTALNFMMHMSGIATLTRHYVEAIRGTKARILDTRKTLPGLRPLQKYAVTMGGGFNHRMGLDDMVMIKDNHLIVSENINEAINDCRERLGHTVKIEVEVDTLEQLTEVLGNGRADIVLLDNMDIQTLEKAVKMVAGKMITEASGGVKLETVKAIAETGVDYISVGALTHSAPALDLGLDFIKPNY
ncbi:MAG: carboxylating nicotinate-nucleotide diphosphorylase [Alphaproteobacteria bacterium]